MRGRRGKSEVTSYRCSLGLVDPVHCFLRLGAAWRTRCPLGDPLSFVLGQHFSETRHLPLSWHSVSSVCSLVAVCIGIERCCNLRLAYIFGLPGHWRVNWGFSVPLLAAFFGLVFTGWCLLEGGVEEKDTYPAVCFST